MRTVSLIYQTSSSFQMAVSQEQLSFQKPYLIFIYTSDLLPEQAVLMAADIQVLFPCSQIIGSSTCGVIYKGEPHPHDTLVTITEFEDLVPICDISPWSDQTPKQLLEHIHLISDGQMPCLVNVLLSGTYPYGDTFAQVFQQQFPGVTLVGGLSGDILPQKQSSYVFDPKQFIAEGMAVALLCSDKLKVYNGVSQSTETFGPRHFLSDCGADQVYTIDHQPADQWLRDQLGMDFITQLDSWEDIADHDILIRFPIVLEQHNGASRFLTFDTNTYCISSRFGHLHQGSQFRIGYISSGACIKDSFRICSELMESPVETLFVYSSFLRRLYLNKCSHVELMPYRTLDISGAYLMGEFSCINGTAEYLNGSCCLIGLAEQERFLLPDLDAFDHIRKLQDDRKELYDHVLKIQEQNISRYSDQLLDQLIARHKESEAKLLLDLYTGWQNSLCYERDLNIFGYDKVCMVKLENSQLLATHLGHDAYIEMLEEAMGMVRDYLNALPRAPLLHPYSFNENTFVISAGKEIDRNTFIADMRDLFDRFCFIYLKGVDNVFITRFVVVVEQGDLIEQAQNALQLSQNAQTPFLVCEGNHYFMPPSDEEYKIIGVLNRAIANDNIVPYFQGIYDNKLKKITRYEALMRIIDQDGTLYIPSQFMEIAKKYHLYSYLSKLMIEKVFSLFEHQMDHIGLNFSIFDFTSVELQKVIMNILEKVKYAPNFVLEVLEDEKIWDMEMLKAFIKQVRKYGVKVAIDDFGSGYSNLLEIASLKPDYIKIDGEIVRHAHLDETNQKILDIIVYLGKLLNTEIIAEYVENQEIQKEIELRQIRYSQGYYFSIPRPYTHLKEELEQMKQGTLS